MSPVAELTEAVLISGPRRGEIVQLSDRETQGWSQEEAELLNSTLDRLMSAVDRLDHEMDLTLAALNKKAPE